MFGSAGGGNFGAVFFLASVEPYARSEQSATLGPTKTGD
jgi:hypothetical protein